MKYKRFTMVCPNCQYKYWYAGEAREFESCPVCGCFQEFGKFVQEVKKED